MVDPGHRGQWSAPPDRPCRFCECDSKVSNPVFARNEAMRRPQKNITGHYLLSRVDGIWAVHLVPDHGESAVIQGVNQVKRVGNSRVAFNLRFNDKSPLVPIVLHLVDGLLGGK